MSYILDALQRAEAERARGGVPTLHARPLADPPPPDRLGKQPGLGLTIAVVVAVLGLAAAGWWMWQPTPAPDGRLAPTVVVQAAAVPAPQPIAAQPAVVAAPEPTRPTVVAPVPPPSKPKTAAPGLATRPEAPVASKAKAAAAAVAKAAEPAAPASALAPLLSELPEATRSQIPAMAISGAVYSDNPSQRLLLVNGQVLNQGSQVAPDLTVVDIRSNSSEFNFKGTRFRMAH